MTFLNTHLAKCLNSECERASRRFQPGEGPSRGLLRDCTTSPINRFAALVTTSCNNGNGRWIVRGLEARGHNVTKLLRGGSVVQAIAVDRNTGEIHANADFRKQGSVDGF